jgi:hypothetical protein
MTNHVPPKSPLSHEVFEAVAISAHNLTSQQSSTDYAATLSLWAAE